MSIGLFSRKFLSYYFVRCIFFRHKLKYLKRNKTLLSDTMLVKEVRKRLKLTLSWIRILFCLLLGTIMIWVSFSYIQSGDAIASIYAPFVMVTGVLVVMFGCMPSLGKAIINALVSMFKFMTKVLSSILRMH